MKVHDLPSTLSDRITVDAENGCWLWQGHCLPGGYGVCYFERKHHRVHRLTYQLLVGEIPEGYHIDHLCHVRECCNPSHLEPITPTENNRRSVVNPAPFKYSDDTSEAKRVANRDAYQRRVSTPGGRSSRNALKRVSAKKAFDALSPEALELRRAQIRTYGKTPEELKSKRELHAERMLNDSDYREAKRKSALDSYHRRKNLKNK